MRERINIIINATVLYVAAFLTTTIIHELAHALIGVLNDSDPVLHHNYVQHFSISQLSIRQQVSIALAGPIVSLMQGLIAGWGYLKFQKQGLYQLFLLWFSVLGFNNFLGYLMTGPLFKAGDIGKAYQLLQSPMILEIIIAGLGAAALLFIAYKITRPFLQFSYEWKWVADRQSRKNFSFRIIILPWILGSGIITVLYLPIVAIISIIYPIMSGMVFIFPWQNAQRIENIELSENNKIGKLSIISICILIALVTVFRMVLAPGVQLYSTQG